MSDFLYLSRFVDIFIVRFSFVRTDCVKTYIRITVADECVLFRSLWYNRICFHLHYNSKIETEICPYFSICGWRGTMLMTEKQVSSSLDQHSAKLSNEAFAINKNGTESKNLTQPNGDNSTSSSVPYNTLSLGMIISKLAQI